ncbi:MAG: ATP-binding protein [Coriobacteriia bacterium]|nr:ATP-binding protein [Coriobacteriia bacterium]
MDNTGDTSLNETPDMLPPRGNLSEGGSTLEEGESLTSMGLGNGVYTVNGGRAGFTNQAQQQADQNRQEKVASPAQQSYPSGAIPQFTYGQNQYQNQYQPPIYPQQVPVQAANQQEASYQQSMSMQAQNIYGQQAMTNYPQEMAFNPQAFGYQQQVTYIPSYQPAQQAHPNMQVKQENPEADTYDYSNIEGSARIAIYDDLHSAPRVIQIPGGATHEFIERIASLTYQHSQTAGGKIPYSVIREVSENFIHAQFKEVVVSILDSGNTIRFTDQGPGIKDKELVQKPGVTSATEAMKDYIRGVGSGLPLVKDALSFSHGTITIEDNVNSGTVVTISLMDKPAMPGATAPETNEHKRKITKNDKKVLIALLEGPAGVSDVSRETDLPVSSVHNSFDRLTQAGLVCEQGKKRALTNEGELIARNER